VNGPVRPYEGPTSYQSPEPLIVGPGQSLTPAQGHHGQILVIQQAAPEPTLLKKYGGVIVLGSIAGAVAVAALLAVAVVAIAVTIGVISLTIALVVIKDVIGPKTQK
jgi:hypothetical protein